MATIEFLVRGAIWLLAAEVREWADHEYEPLMT